MKEHLPATGAALVVGAARFVPLPLVDDWVASYSRQRLAKALLVKHGRTFPVRDLRAVTDDGSWLGLPWRMVKNVVTFPVRKILKPLLPFLLVRDVALAIGRTLALAHTLDRQLRLGSFRDDESAEVRKDAAARLRKAFDAAFSGIDQRVVGRAARAVVNKARGNSADVEGFLAELDRRVDQALAELPLR